LDIGERLEIQGEQRFELFWVFAVGVLKTICDRLFESGEIRIVLGVQTLCAHETP
jgi:hypothetical protein